MIHHRNIFVKPHNFLNHNALGFGRNNIYLAEIILRKKCISSQFYFCRLWQKLLFITEFSQKYTLLIRIMQQMIERNHSTASLVHRNYFCCMIKYSAYKIRNIDRKCLYFYLDRNSIKILCQLLSICDKSA